ncbi:ATP-binding SpoIIE family protein phosphatase [Streptomyces sp. NPDC054794]
MEPTADGLLSRAAHELGSKADELTAGVERCLRQELPELWEYPDVMASQNIAEHVDAVLDGLEYIGEPGEIQLPVGDVERSRRLARHGKPVSTALRAFRLAQGVILDSLLEELPRLTNDPELLSAATRKLIAVSTEYVDRTSEQGVVAFQEERDRRLRWQLSVVNEASMRIGTTLHIARTAQELVDLAIEQFADMVTVDLLESVLHGRDTPAADPLVVRRIAQRSAVDGSPELTITPQQLHTCPAGCPSGRALATGQPSRHRLDASHLPDGSVPAADPNVTPGDQGIDSKIVAPLRARDTTLGVAEFFRHRRPELFDDADLLFVQDIAARAAVAIDNALRYTHARATALTLQHSLLPRHAPRQSAVEVAYRYLPAGSDAGVGGDWYDVIPLSGARVALVVGDVAGHGIRAAATMGRLRTAVRTLADIDLPPDELLTHLDDVVLRLSAEASSEASTETPTAASAEPSTEASTEASIEASIDPDAENDGDVGATCLYAVYDPVSRRCTLARAGHVPPVVVRQDGNAELLDLPPGPPLGLGGLPFESMEFELSEGSLIALYTDGLIEARDHDVDAGLTALRHALAQFAPSLETVCDSVLDALLPAQPDDDIALLVARTRALGADQVATWDVEADPSVVARVRADVSQQLSTWGLEGFDFTAALVVSELVTNAIRYGRSPIKLRLIHDRTLLCEVSDASGTTPHLRRARTSDEGGRGLLLVAQFAEQWGTRHARHGKTVWAELNESAAFPEVGLVEGV